MVLFQMADAQDAFYWPQIMSKVLLQPGLRAVHAG